MKTVLAFFLGVREFRSSLTTNYLNDDLNLAYDRRRELAPQNNF